MMSTASPAELIPQALQLHRAKKHAEARAVYEQVLGLFPNHFDALHLLGMLCFEMGRHEESLRYLSHALRQNASQAFLHNHYGIVLKATGNIGQAQAAFQEAVRIEPEYADAHSNLGNIYKLLGQKALAEERYQTAARLRPEHADVHFNLGNLCLEQGRYGEAETHYRRAVELNPRHQGALNNLGNAQRSLNKSNSAIESYRRALEIDAECLEALNNLGLLYREQGNEVAARECFEQVQRIENRRGVPVSAASTPGTARPDPGQLGELYRFKRAYVATQEDLAKRLASQGHSIAAQGCLDRARQTRIDFATAQNRRGVQLQDERQFDKALLCYQQAVELLPDYANAHNNLGTAYKALGKWDEAETSYRKAVELQPDYAEAHNNLGNALRARRKVPDAEASFRRALDLKPTYADAHNNLGVILQDQQKFDEAIAAYQQAVSLRPDYAEAHNNLGTALKARGKLPEARAAYEKAIGLRPGYAAAHNNLGNVLRETGQLEAAVKAYQQALQLAPHHPDGHNNLGVLYQDLNRLDDAQRCYQEAIRLFPNFAEAHNNLGTVHKAQGRSIDSLLCYRRAIKIRENYAEAYSNLGNVYKEFAQFPEAEECYQKALALNPDYADAHLNYSLGLLLKGDYDRGWSEYEWRWKSGKGQPRPFQEPAWQGEPLAGKTLLVYAEQGLGDTLQFIRYAQLVKAQGPQVIFECQPALQNILASCPGIDQLVPQGKELPPFDYHVPLLSLPGLLKTDAKNIPGSVPYLFAKPDLVDYWSTQIGPIRDLKVGLSWQGNPRFRADKWRSVPLKFWEPILQIPGVRFFSVQKNDGREQLVEYQNRYPLVDWSNRLDEEHGPFMDTAAVLKNLDLLISSDTAVPHLAGALGVPTWILIPYAPDWRWQLGCDENPWYPTFRLFRQTALLDWGDVCRRIADELSQLVARRRLPPPRSPLTRTPGEMLARLVQLELDLARLASPADRLPLEQELATLTPHLETWLTRHPPLAELTARLRIATAALTGYQHRLDQHHTTRNFGPSFIDLSQDAHHAHRLTHDLQQEITRLVQVNA